MNGSVGFTGQSPSAAWRSVWHTPHASVLTTIWRGPGAGISHSRNTKGLPNCSTTAAFILDGIYDSFLLEVRLNQHEVNRHSFQRLRAAAAVKETPAMSV